MNFGAADPLRFPSVALDQDCVGHWGRIGRVISLAGREGASLPEDPDNLANFSAAEPGTAAVESWLAQGEVEVDDAAAMRVLETRVGPDESDGQHTAAARRSSIATRALADPDRNGDAFRGIMFVDDALFVHPDVGMGIPLRQCCLHFAWSVPPGPSTTFSTTNRACWGRSRWAWSEAST
jgi:hypothetical protein